MQKELMNRNDQGFKQRIISRAPGLLEMFYLPTELAEELGVTEQTVQYWLRDGLPYEITDMGDMVVGTEACTWIQKTFRKEKPHVVSDENSGYCFRCKAKVIIQRSSIRVIGSTLLKTGTCPNCKTTVNRGISLKGAF